MLCHTQIPHSKKQNKTKNTVNMNDWKCREIIYQKISMGFEIHLDVIHSFAQIVLYSDFYSLIGL